MVSINDARCGVSRVSVWGNPGLAFGVTLG